MTRIIAFQSARMNSKKWGAKMEKNPEFYFQHTYPADAPVALLHLHLEKRWYDKIASGEKRSEFRRIGSQWDKILTNFAKRAAENKMQPIAVFYCGYPKDGAGALFFRILRIGYCGWPNDLCLKECWQIKLGEKLDAEWGQMHAARIEKQRKKRKGAKDAKQDEKESE